MEQYLKKQVTKNKECKKINTPLKEGDAVITSSCNMTNCKYIIHAVSPNLNKNKGAINKIFDAYYNSLDVLMKNNLHTIAFPLISAGIYSGFIKNPVLESTKFCIMAYEKFVKEHKNYNIAVILCAYTSKEYEEANKEFSFNKYIDSIEKKEIELSNEIFDSIDYNKIIAVTIAEGGAMGEPNGFYAVDDKFNLYHTNFAYGKVNFEKLKNKFILFNEEVDMIEKNWSWFYMGFGNYLLVRTFLGETIKKFIDEYFSDVYKHAELYDRWFYMLKYINEKEYE